MSVEEKRNGALRLRCEGRSCAQLFVPLRTFTDARELRKRAQLQGWTFRRGRDYCPADRPRQLALGAGRL